LPHLLENQEFTEMLLKEARLAARVRHPNVAATLDVVATKGDVLLVLDYVHGEALSTLCRTQAKQKKEQVPLPIATSITLDMLQGLAAIHDATDEKGRSLSLVHRDISPPNVLVGADGVARVLDFGIATALDHIEETAPERRKGKRGYMSPEQLRGERLTQRSDVFSAGIVIWELLALRRLFPADQEKEPGDAVLRGDYPRLSRYRPDLPAALDDIVMRALSCLPDARFASMHELFDAFEAAAPARANTRRISEWVNELAKDALAARNRMVARVENWESAEIPLRSTPFAAELPLRPASASWPPPPPEVFEANMPLLDLEAPPLLAPAPAPLAPALRSSRPPVPSSAALPARAPSAPPRRSGSLWWLWALLLAGVAAYVLLHRR
jgi:eukaryotic-like serine/threonine-protein kinase